MPLARYFLYVGGVLLTLLFILDVWFPRFPVAERANANLPAIRIHSDRKWPERIVFDTSLPAIIAPQIAREKGSIPATATYVSVKATEREALAQMQPSDAKQLQPPNSKKREPYLQRKGKIARRYAAPLPFLAARQPQLGWFRNSFWGG
jgi:hypothetical protein